MKPGQAATANQKIVRRLLFAVVGMFGFGFAMVPLYNVFCEITGLNGKTGGRVAVVDMEPDLSRTVTVEFIASVNESMPWEFRPEVSSMKVHPGKMYRASYYAQNQTDKVMTGNAVPSVTPGVAAQHFKKTECFCFTEQRFSAGEGRDMPVLFMVDRDLPEDVEVVTLAYTFFEQKKVLN
jgi:cytochrome c oxidase assembly protein subunit 11